MKTCPLCHKEEGTVRISMWVGDEIGPSVLICQNCAEELNKPIHYDFSIGCYGEAKS